MVATFRLKHACGFSYSLLFRIPWQARLAVLVLPTLPGTQHKYPSHMYSLINGRRGVEEVASAVDGGRKAGAIAERVVLAGQHHVRHVRGAVGGGVAELVGLPH